MFLVAVDGPSMLIHHTLHTARLYQVGCNVSACSRGVRCTVSSGTGPPQRSNRSLTSEGLDDQRFGRPISQSAKFPGKRSFCNVRLGVFTG